MVAILTLVAIALGVTTLGAGAFGIFQWGKASQATTTIDNLTSSISLGIGGANLWTTITGVVMPVLLIVAIVVIIFIIYRKKKR